jgi:DNA repair protein RadA/Sms
MSKTQTYFVCSECGADSLRWSGKCDVCGAWNTMKEYKVEKDNRSQFKQEKVPVPKSLDEISEESFLRIQTNLAELDRVLGGGIVAGEVILLGGDPGIGKSTLLFQTAQLVEVETIYVSGEESLEQIKIRSKRLAVKQNQKLKFLAETNIDAVLSILESLNVKLLIIDSIQTMYSADFPSSPGSVVQVRECALKLQQFAKNRGISVILVGHVTKEGSVAGPRVLEHLVDAVLYLEGDRFQSHRILRAVKNRFGGTNEVGVFEMTAEGMEEVQNPSAIFLAERINSPGSVVVPIISGSRPFLVEIQALTSPTTFGYPKRQSVGFDLNRLNMLIAILTKKAGLKLETQDVYLNVVGGMKIQDPAADLAVCLAIASAWQEKPIPDDLIVFGEVGLSGEIRSVPQYEKREAEAKRLGFNNIISYKNKKLLSEIISML